MSDVEVTRLDELPPSTIAREFVGADHGGVGICAIFVEAPPGAGPSLHRHPYPEIAITKEGTATSLRGEEGEPGGVGAGEMVVIPAGQWHAFVNSGDGPLRQVDIHVSASFDTEWLPRRKKTRRRPRPRSPRCRRRRAAARRWHRSARRPTGRAERCS